MHSGYNDIWPPPRFDKDFFKAQTIQSAGKNIIYSYHDTLAILAEVKTEFKNVNFQVKRLLNLAVCVAPHGFCGLAAFGIDLYLWGLSTHIDFV